MDKVKLIYTGYHTGFCRIMFREKRGQIFCFQEDYPNEFKLYFCSKDEEPAYEVLELNNYEFGPVADLDMQIPLLKRFDTWLITALEFSNVKLSKWDIRFVKLAEHIAQWSKDPSTKVGAVLVAAGGKNQVAFGFNGFPPGVQDTKERLHNRELKYLFVQHAERNVLDNASFDSKGATLYTTKFPCTSCAKSIISKGVIKIVSTRPDFNHPTWGTEAKIALEMFNEVNIQVYYT